MSKSRITMIIPALFLIFCVQTAFAQVSGMPDGCTYILMELKTGQVIAQQDADKKVRPASTTKIMTAILALENGKLDQIMDVSKAAVYDIGDGGSNIGINPGETNLTLEHLLNAMLIKSANETANIVAENICETRGEFIDLMNKKAAELGAVNTHFVNPCGKDDAKEDANHLSTARDMAVIARYAMNIPKFREIVGKEYYEDMPVTNTHQAWDPLRTTNKLLWPKNLYSYELNGTEHTYTVNGIKTGYTSAARNNLIVSAVNEEGMELIAAIMYASGSSAVFSSAKKLLGYGFEHYALQKLTDADRIVRNVAVEDAKDNERLDLVTASDFYCALPVEESQWNIEVKEDVNPAIKAPVNAGDILGNVEYSRSGLILGKVNLIASKSLEKASKEAAPEEVRNTGGVPLAQIISMILLALAFLILLRVVLRKVSRKMRRKKKYPIFRR